MKPAGYVSAVIAFIVGASTTFAIVRWLGKGSPELGFVVGAVLGTQIAAVVHHRTPGAVSSPGVKAGVGAALALSTIVLGLALHTLWKPFDHPEVSIPIAVVGAFVFPFVLFGQMWNALLKKPGACAGPLADRPHVRRHTARTGSTKANQHGERPPEAHRD